MAPPITIAVATDDKISTIADALNSARACPWCDELLVFDSGSTDGSADVAKELADRVEFHEWTTYADSKRRMCEAARNDWVFILDADEQITPELAAEIDALPDNAFPDHPVMTMPRKNYLLGRHVKAWDPDRQNRLFDRTRVAWPDRSIHDERKPTEGSERALSSAILHNSTVNDWHGYFDGPRYADRIDKMAREMYDAGKRVGFVGLWLRPPLALFKYFILKGGFTQGAFGLVIAQKAAVFTQLKYARLWHLQQTEGRG